MSEIVAEGIIEAGRFEDFPEGSIGWEMHAEDA